MEQSLVDKLCEDCRPLVQQYVLRGAGAAGVGAITAGIGAITVALEPPHHHRIEPGVYYL